MTWLLHVQSVCSWGGGPLGMLYKPTDGWEWWVEWKVCVDENIDTNHHKGHMTPA